MNGHWLLAGTGVGTVVLMVAAFMMLRLINYERTLATRVQLSQGLAPRSPSGTLKEGVHNAWTRAVAMLGQLILRTGLLPTRTRAELGMTLMSAGLRGRNGLEIFIGAKIGLLVGLPFLAMLAMRRIAVGNSFLHLVVPMAAGVAGLLLPDMVVRHRRKKYVARVERGLPDALDLLVICAQAGLGLTAAIVRVADEMQQGGEDIGVELALTANELRLIADSRVALLNMGTRTGIDGLVRLGTTLVQSMQYGTPLSDSMRLLSAEMRQETLTRYEAKAGRLGVLLSLPMIAFILPCLFLIVGGPAAVQVMHIGSE
jgi:tight adherence protein C